MACTRRASRSLAVALLAAAGLWAASDLYAFVAPTGTGSGSLTVNAATVARLAQAVDVMEISAAEVPIQDKVQALRIASFEACMLATEETPELVLRCADLSYELSTAEMILTMRKDEDTYTVLDSDSY
mmetsp:Transcript_49812/g.126617  ORF Transcript_49812/g.126617 Transcript_49812/m.126617 type:complete len:128 (-) Transcript_49812:109-492(-)